MALLLYAKLLSGKLLVKTAEGKEITITPDSARQLQADDRLIHTFGDRVVLAVRNEKVEFTIEVPDEENSSSLKTVKALVQSKLAGVEVNEEALSPDELPHELKGYKNEFGELDAKILQGYDVPDILSHGDFSIPEAGFDTIPISVNFDESPFLATLFNEEILPSTINIATSTSPPPPQENDLPSLSNAVVGFDETMGVGVVNGDVQGENEIVVSNIPQSVIVELQGEGVNTTGIIGAAQQSIEFDPGDDGLGSFGFNVATGDNTGFDKTDGSDIFYFVVDPNFFLGVTNIADPSNTTVFSGHLDDVAGVVTLVFFEGFFHPNSADPDDPVQGDIPIILTDGNGDSVQSVIQISHQDDAPKDISPMSATVANSAVGMVTKPLDFFGNVGTDTAGGVVFTGFMNGDQLLDTDSNPLTSNAMQIYLFGVGTTMLIATTDGSNMDESQQVFSINLNPDGHAELSDTYTIDVMQKIDNQFRFNFDDFSAAPAGTNWWIGIDDPRVGMADQDQDIMLTGFDSMDHFVQLNSNGVSIGVENENVATNPRDQGLRIDYVTAFDFTGDTKDASFSGLNYGAHYNVSEAGYTLVETGGSDTNRIDNLVSAFDAPDFKGGFFSLGELHLIKVVTSVRIEDGMGNILIDTTMDGASSIDPGLSVDFINDFFNPGAVQINGLLEGYQVFVSTADGFNRMTILNNTAGNQPDDTMDAGGFEVKTFDSGDSVDISVGLLANDQDLDTSTGAINATLLPSLEGDANANTLDGTGNPDFILGFSGNDTIDGMAGHDFIDGGADNDSLTGGPGDDSFIFDLRVDFGDDTITDFESLNDLLSFLNVSDAESDGDLDVSDVNADLTSVTDNGLGMEVTFNFSQGGSITVMGAGTGSVDSIDDIVNDASNQVVVS